MVRLVIRKLERRVGGKIVRHFKEVDDKLDEM